MEVSFNNCSVLSLSIQETNSFQLHLWGDTEYSPVTPNSWLSTACHPVMCARMTENSVCFLMRAIQLLSASLHAWGLQVSE